MGVSRYVYTAEFISWQDSLAFVNPELWLIGRVGPAHYDPGAIDYRCYC